MEEFTEIMSKHSDDELLDIIIVKAFNYEDAAVEAAERELNNREIPNLTELKEDLIARNFNNLTIYSNEELINLIERLKIDNDKEEKEILHILNMGKVPLQKSKFLMTSVNKRIKDFEKGNSRRNMLYGAFWCIGGIIVTYISYLMDSPNGTYLVWSGAIIYGVIRFFKGLKNYIFV